MATNSSSLLNRTPLFHQHQDAGGKLVDFGGWELPVNYGSQIEEHHAVRQQCGMFDVSHMTVSDVTGSDALLYLSKLLANDITKATSKPGKALYSCMLNANGGVIDDLIVYFISPTFFRLVSNAGTNKKVVAWLVKQTAGFEVSVTEQKELALLAVQGPEAMPICAKILRSLGEEYQNTLARLERFQGGFFNVDGEQQFVARTGYTGEDGVEFIVTHDLVTQLWDSLQNAGVQPCGLGARDTLRLEAGMALYGNELDEQHSPIESGLAWTVQIQDERNFIGQQALDKTPDWMMVGLTLLERGVLRGHQKLYLNQQEIGDITSGTFSPSFETSIALARVRQNAQIKTGDNLKVAMRNKLLDVTVIDYPFIKNSEPTSPLLTLS